jgi:putative SOS response-associated peptidase YedK
MCGRYRRTTAEEEIACQYHIPSAPSYRQAFRKRRCLIPADGFYEWRKVLGGKIPYNIQMKDGRPFAFAGLWEGWKPPGSEDWIRTFTIITGEPNELIREIHTRMLTPNIASV